jgi:hypothetical protein
MDNLGNSMIAEPKEVVVRKTTEETTMDKMIEGLKQNGKYSYLKHSDIMISVSLI